METSNSAYDKAINWQLGEQLAGGKLDLAKELLQMLVEKLPADRETIQAARNHNDQAELEKHVHKLHSATCYCGTPRLKAAAKAVEDAVRAGNSDINELLDTLDTEIEAVLTAAAGEVQLRHIS